MASNPPPAERIDEHVPPAVKVLHTAELLEQILVNVTDTKALLLAQRVNKFWSEIIKDSSKLQKKLFFSPATHDELVSLCMIELGASDEGDTNSSDDEEGEHSSDGDKGEQFSTIKNRSVFVNFSSRKAKYSPPSKYALVNTLVCGGSSKTMSALKLNIPLAFATGSYTLASAPSWIRMQVSQPPVPVVEAIGTFARWKLKGDKIRHILDCYNHFQKLQPNSSFKMQLRIAGIAADLGGYERALQWLKLAGTALPQDVEHESVSDDDDDQSDAESYGYDDRYDDYYSFLKFDELCGGETSGEDLAKAQRSGGDVAEVESEVGEQSIIDNWEILKDADKAGSEAQPSGLLSEALVQPLVETVGALRTGISDSALAKKVAMTFDDWFLVCADKTQTR